MKITKEAKIGIISLLAIVAFYALYSFLNGKNVFTSGDIYYVTYSDVNGLLPTKPVIVNGLKIGQVEEIKIIEEPDSLYFVVKMVLDRKIDFSKSTVAEIYEPGLLEGKMIQLKLSYNGPAAQSGDTLLAESNPSLMNMISDKLKPTQNKIDTVLTTLNTTLTSVGNLTDEQSNRSLKAVLRELENTVAALKFTANSLTETSRNANILISKTNENFSELTGNTNAALTNASTTMSKYGLVADKINALELEATLSNLEEATSNLNRTLSRLENSDGSLNKLINDDALYNNLNSTSKNLDLLISDIKQNPSKYIQFSVFGKKTIIKEVEVDESEL